MADVTLASLNFKMILDDKEFNEQIKAVTDEAQKMNTEVSKLLEGLNKVSSGRMSQSKKNEMLLSLRNEIKATEADIANLTRRMESWQTHAKKFGSSPYIQSDNVKNKMREVSNEIENAKKKLTELQNAYKKLGGDKALSSTFKDPFDYTGPTQIT